MKNFINFIKNPEKYSSTTFLDNNKKEIDKLNKIKFKKCAFKKEKIKFENKSYQKLYDNSPGLPTIKTIFDNPKKYYIIMGGIRMIGARYPDYIINKKDILYLKKVLEEYGIMDIPISNIKLVIEKCIELVQEKLRTFLFNDGKARWMHFVLMTNSFRNMCMNIETYEKYKNKFVPTSLSMLLYFTGDCREHRLLLLYLMRIYLYYNDINNTYLCESVYTIGGHGELVNKKMKLVSHNYEHTFAILIDKTTQDIIVIDAMEHPTKIVKNPEFDTTLYKNIKVISDSVFASGYFRKDVDEYKCKGKPYLFKLVDWWSKTPCKYTDDKHFNNKMFLYGISFKPINIKYVFDKSFNNLITKRLFNSELCLLKFKTLKLRKTTRKRRKRKSRKKTKRKRRRKRSL